MNNTVPDFIIPDSDLTAEELKEEERELEAKRPKIERRLREGKKSDVNIFDFLNELKASKNHIIQ